MPVKTEHLQLRRRWIVRLLATAGLFPVVVGLGTSFVLLVTACIGYLPYSDRPGPGWQHAHWPTLPEMYWYFGFTLLALPISTIFALGFAALCIALSWAQPPKWLTRVLAGLLGFFTGGLIAAAAGWYIAMSQIGIYAGAVFGLLYGIWLFPRYVFPVQHRPHLWVRWLLPSAVAVFMLFWVARPFIPQKPVAGINVETWSIEPASGFLDLTKERSTGSDFVTSKMLDDVAALNIHGVNVGGCGQTILHSDNVPPQHFLVINQQPLIKRATLKVPKEGDVIWYWDGQLWRSFPSTFKAAKQTLDVDPSSAHRWHNGACASLGR